jgi:hypothetical protein
VHLQTPQAATAFKHQLDSIYKDQQHAKKPTAVFNPPHINPFKTLPKDVPARDKSRGDRASSQSYGGNQGGTGGGNYNRFNNNRGNFNNRGGQNNAGFQNRNFSSPVGGGMGAGMGFGGPAPMNNFGANPMGGMNNFGGGFNRGGMMGGMRGGMNNRGGRGGNMGMNNMGAGMNMPMAGGMMGMGGGMMGMGGNMGMMGAMGTTHFHQNRDTPHSTSPTTAFSSLTRFPAGGPGGFAGQQPHFNPAFFNQNQGVAEQNWNPHGAKRPRPE